MSDTTSLSAQVNKLNLTDASSTASSTTEPSEIVAVVDELLNELSTKFNSVSSEIVSKMDEMSKRLDALESHIQAGNEAATPKGDASGEK